MKILVTGGAGYIGGTVARLLLDRGHQVTILDNFCHARRSLLPAGAGLEEAGLEDRARVENVLRSQRIDAVLHFAALIEAGESMHRPEIYFRNNTAGSLALLEAMHACGVGRLVFSSTAAVYGNPRQTPIAETAPLEPTNAYGESKLAVERMLAWFARAHGLACTSLRYFNVAGALELADGSLRGEAHEPESHLIPLILDVALGRRQAIRVYGEDYPTPDGTCVRDYIHVADLAEAHLLALDALVPGTGQQVYNLGNGRGFSVREVIAAARRVTGHPIPVETEPRRPGDPAILVAGSEKIRRELGWQPGYTELDAIVASAWKWHRQYYGGQ